MIHRWVSAGCLPKVCGVLLYHFAFGVVGPVVTVCFVVGCTRSKGEFFPSVFATGKWLSRGRVDAVGVHAGGGWEFFGAGHVVSIARRRARGCSSAL